jgi:hypothetical protein
MVRLNFQPVRCGYTLRITSKTLYSPEYITSKHTQKISWPYSEIPHTRTQYMHLASYSSVGRALDYTPKVADSNRCGYTLRVTSKTLYSPEYITSKHKQKSHCVTMTTTSNTSYSKNTMVLSSCTKTRNTNPEHRNSTEQPGTARNTYGTARNSTEHLRNSTEHLRNSTEHLRIARNNYG